MKVYQLHIGSGATQKLSADEEVRICAQISRSFESFTVLRGRGYFRGRPEDMLIVKIATTDEEAVWQLAHMLRKDLNQDGVGVELDGVYHRATKGLAAGQNHLGSAR